MRPISLKLLLVFSSLSLIGGLIRSDKMQDNPPKKNSVAVVVEKTRETSSEDVAHLEKEVAQREEKIQAVVEKIATVGQQKRAEAERLQQEEKEQALAAAQETEKIQAEAAVAAQQQESVASQPVVNQEQQQNQAAPPSQEVQASERSAPVSPTYQAMSIYIGGVQIPYQNGGQGSGQAIIDSNPYGTASTWGGAAVQSGSDGLSTHFIGHNPGVFANIFQLGIGSPVVITESDGTATTYIVNQIYQVDDYAVELGTGRELWDLVTGSGNGEQVVFQACINDHVNLIVVGVK